MRIIHLTGICWAVSSCQSLAMCNSVVTQGVVRTCEWCPQGPDSREVVWPPKRCLAHCSELRSPEGMELSTA